MIEKCGDLVGLACVFWSLGWFLEDSSLMLLGCFSKWDVFGASFSRFLLFGTQDRFLLLAGTSIRLIFIYGRRQRAQIRSQFFDYFILLCVEHRQPRPLKLRKARVSPLISEYRRFLIYIYFLSLRVQGDSVLRPSIFYLLRTPLPALFGAQPVQMRFDSVPAFEPDIRILDRNYDLFVTIALRALARLLDPDFQWFFADGSSRRVEVLVFIEVLAQILLLPLYIFRLSHFTASFCLYILRIGHLLIEFTRCNLYSINSQPSQPLTYLKPPHSLQSLSIDMWTRSLLPHPALPWSAPFDKPGNV